MTNDVHLNGCIVPKAEIELNVLLRGQKAVSIYLVCDAAIDLGQLTATSVTGIRN